MFSMKSPISRSHNVDLDDQSNVKFSLTALGYYDDTDEDLSPYSSEQMFDSIKKFQKNNNLKVDGLINPEGETHTGLKIALKDDEKAGDAFQDFYRNREEMKKADTRGADKYFHCKANYEATDRGWVSEIISQNLSLARETYGTLKGDPASDRYDDMKANIYGQEASKSGRYKNSRDACAVFRVEGLSDEY